MRSFKSNENIHKKEGGSFYVVCAYLLYYKFCHVLVLSCRGSVMFLSKSWLVYMYNIKSEMRSFKSNENVHKKEGGSYYKFVLI